jgi:tripartite-type tricarboxylate transporter receptor subunit TctC
MTILAHRNIALALAGFALVATATPSLAAEDFYAGKQIRMLVGTDANGTYDSYGRMLAKHMGKHIPGHPTFVVQNMPGASSIKMTNYVYSAAPQDGTILAIGQSTVPVLPLTSPNEATYDTAKLIWIGSTSRDTLTGYVWHTAPLQKFEDAKTMPIIMGGSAAGTFSIDSALISNAIFGTKFKIIVGYKSSGETKLAVEKEEVQGVMATSWNSLKREKAWWDGNKVRLIVQYGLQKSPQLPADLPLFVDFAQTDEAKAVARFWVSVLEAGKPFFTTPNTPADKVEILRRAFDATMKDPEFLADIEATGERIDGPMTGENLTKLVAEEARTPPSVVKLIHDTVQAYLKDGSH